MRGIFNRLNTILSLLIRFFMAENIVQKHRSIAPTLLQNISFEDNIMQDEIFGPILPVITFENLDEVIAKVKEREKPLALYIYSKSKKTIQKILYEISFGGGAINESLVHLSNPIYLLGVWVQAELGIIILKQDLTLSPIIKVFCTKPLGLNPI